MNDETGKNENDTMVIPCAKSAFHGVLLSSIVVKGLVTEFLKYRKGEKQRKTEKNLVVI